MYGKIISLFIIIKVSSPPLENGLNIFNTFLKQLFYLANFETNLVIEMSPPPLKKIVLKNKEN